MATPPPEAPSVIKEEKPQLPPSPNGVSDGGPAGVKSPAPDAKPDASVNGTSEPTSPKPAAVNGHGADQKTPANGADAASPPKSPARTPVDASPQQPASSEAAKPSNMDSAATDENTKETVGDNPTSSGPTAQEPTNGTGADKPIPSDPQPVQDAAKPSAEEPSSGTSGEGKSQQPQESPSVKTELPHHPPTSAKPDSASNDAPASNAPSVPPLQTTDQEMKDAPDAPVSPTKVSREREPDPADEPAAKRTKIGGEGSAPVEFKAPEPPTPATEGPAQAKANGETSMTKVQHKFLLKGIQTLKRTNDARFYREPVDPIKLNIPHYPQFIKKPMDLGTIERKLKDNEYKSAQAVVDDFALMVQNALTFNGADHVVSQEGQRLKAAFDKQLVNLPKPDEVEEKKPKKASQKEPRTSIGHTPTARATGNSPQATTFALGPEGLPLIRRDSTTVDGRPKRSIHPPKRDLPYSTKPKKKKYQWELRFCQELLDDLHKPRHYNYALPFYWPVDPVALNIPTYHNIIKKPMDLSTVQSKLKTGQYENSKEFEADMRLIFKNCFKFNIVGDPTYLAGQKFQEVFNEKWAQKARYLEAHEPHPEHHSAASSEESEEEAEESESDNEKLGLLQKQIEEMSRQVEAITQKKKKTPPGSKKVGTTKSKSASKKEGKKPASANPVKKDKKSSSSKISKPEKPRWVTYNEKQVISNGISSLPDKKMQEALKIIQSNVPSLKGTQETEIELDIDELPNDVLLMLLKFVKKNAPHVMEEEEAPPAPATTNANAHAAPPKPKKNKPMSKYEQEAQINMLQSNLSRFEGGGGRSPDPMPSVEANESSDDSDDDSEESEEE
ncbi:Bromodomain-containing protein [Aspergillus steynii IBT 23096]|uniref:Bromodomain-containing protein n=1 Tax=Aspergillus steynii IBT 23096 TaxID=1392250 RepID=A0A2I2GQ37_9EURO|nr:Bromodomain-containing protein [Aspergillus steynii IBT 23096]PLB54980.1 Bromodomain-containing protein [Aspergillus steynii IBT 23096]